MFVGHYAVALAAKKAEPRLSLGMLFLAVQFLDLMWPLLLLLGLEHVRIDPGNTAFTPLEFYDYPISHSLLSVLVWSLVFTSVYYLAKRYLRGALVLGACVLSHWILDFITHRPDLPLAPGAKIYVGLGLWNSVTATVLIEGALFVGCVFLYRRATSAKDRTGDLGFWLLIGFLFLAWIGNMIGPPPPNETVLAATALLLWLIIPWGHWIERHRRSGTRVEIS